MISFFLFWEKAKFPEKSTINKIKLLILIIIYKFLKVTHNAFIPATLQSLIAKLTTTFKSFFPKYKLFPLQTLLSILFSVLDTNFLVLDTLLLILECLFMVLMCYLIHLATLFLLLMNNSVFLSSAIQKTQS